MCGRGDDLSGHTFFGEKSGLRTPKCQNQEIAQRIVLFCDTRFMTELETAVYDPRRMMLLYTKPLRNVLRIGIFWNRSCKPLPNEMTALHCDHFSTTGGLSCSASSACC